MSGQALKGLYVIVLLAGHPATDTPVWWLFGATAFLATAAWLALGQLREVKKDRHIKLMSDFGRRWDEPHLWEAREKQIEIANDDLARRVSLWFGSRSASAQDVPILLRVPNYFEDLALAVEIGSIEVKYVDLWMGSLILNMWSYWEPAIQEMRKTAPKAYAQFERLVRDLEAAKPLG